ncbi:MAG: ammonium transporter [Deltaproteobacteria bacterium]|nr:ammonium transporter [Deltaproteobacteria bacterium]MBW2447606.1 ammonium transporter [Deltaproteobacteria bacterium]
MRFRNSAALATLGALGIAAPAAAQEAALDTGDTAWILTASALVLFMTIPGLSLFYAGLVRTKNVLSVLMQCLALTALCTLLWLIVGYSLAFGDGNAFIGGFGKVFARGIEAGTLSGTIPEILFFLFQMTFAIITPALIVGAFAERMKFSAMLWFSGLWLLLVYAPICHMTWGGEGTYFGDMGVFDFAGGIVVHITAGVAALVCCIVIGPRKNYPTTPMPPHNLTMCVTGTGMLWVGWYGFNGGSALGANGDAAMAIAVTQISAATAAFTWMMIEWVNNGKPSVLGMATGAIAGLAAVTPASGFIGPVGGFGIGLAAGFICWWASTVIKIRLGYDDSLDVFGVHGVGGFVGTVLAGVFAAEMFGGKEGDLAIVSQVVIQLKASIITIIYTGVVSFVLLKAIDATIGLRVTHEQEVTGLDTTLHAEAGYDL